jgi:beta-lactamase regulating signal transducer with metallopeptidase domain
MSASYDLRLLIQCLNLFFFVHLLFSAGVFGLTPLALSCSERIRPVRAVRLLLLLRLFPFLAAAYAALALALPSYLRLEPDNDSERIGMWAVVCTGLAIAVWIRPAARTVRALRNSTRFVKQLQSIAQTANIAAHRVWVLREDAPRIAVAGVLRPRVLLSESAIEILSPSELQLVLLHEKAHQQSRDNLKRLLLLILPDVLPFVTFTSLLDQQCKRLVEWAADDFAVAGDRQNSLSLAGALVSLARHQTRAALCTLATSFIEDASGLARRVERLLCRAESSRASLQTCAGSAVLAGLTISMFAAAVHFADLSNVHRVLEVLSH